MVIAVILGFLQGIFEWLPVSSEGVVAAFYAFFLERPLDEAVAFALWLHLGTVVSAIVALRWEIVDLLRGFLAQPTKPSRMFMFLLVSTTVSAVIGFPMLLPLDELSTRFGAIAMGIIGVFMFITGGLQLRSRVVGTRDREEVTVIDALLAGVVQGFAVLPGLSRSGLTVAALLSRRVDRKEALVLSFLMSIPASLGASLYSAIDSNLFASREAIIAMLVAAVVGLVSIKLLLAVAERINFAWFVIIVGAMVLAGGIWQAFG